MWTVLQDKIRLNPFITVCPALISIVKLVTVAGTFLYLVTHSAKWLMKQRVQIPLNKSNERLQHLAKAICVCFVEESNRVHLQCQCRPTMHCLDDCRCLLKPSPDASGQKAEGELQPVSKFYSWTQSKWGSAQYTVYDSVCVSHMTCILFVFL